MNEPRTFRLVNSLTPEENRILFEWGDNIWGSTSPSLTWRPKDFHLLCYSGGKLVSHASYLYHTIAVGARTLRIAGAGGVVCVPEAQHCGHASATVKELTETLRKQNEVPFALGICQPALVPFYRRLGWQLIDGPVLIEQTGTNIPCPLPVVVIPLGNEPWPSGKADLCSEPW